MPRIRYPRRALLVLIVMISLVAGALTPGAGAVSKFPVADGLTTLFVELQGAPTNDEAVTNARAQAALIAREQQNFRAAAQAERIKLTENFVYTSLFNGFSVTVSNADLPKLARLPGVINIYPVIMFELPELHSSTEMIRAPQAVAEGLDGTGVKVAVIDTGIDYNHPDLGSCIGPSCRVIGGYDFVGDTYTGPGSPIVPDEDPMDHNGHGTHVAGIIGANAASATGVTGVAPNVSLLAYKVFGATGSTSADVINAALERALADGADVVNMSLGSSFQWPQYPTARAADRLVQRGVVVSVSAGNSGTSGLFATGAPAVGSKVMAVASFDNTMMTVLKAAASDGTDIGYAELTHSPPAAGQTYEVVAVPNLGASDADYAGLDVTGKVALISRGAVPFSDKAARAMHFGAAAAIIHNNAPGLFFGTLGTPDNAGQPWIPTLSMSQADGDHLRALEGASPTTVTFTDEALTVGNPTAGQISSFSSWGPSPDLSLKPDVGAPGGFIYSTYPLAFGGYATLSGTSMAAPHAAGAAALLLQAQPKLRGHHVQELLSNTAVPGHFSTTPYLWPTNRQGAGMIDVLAALYTPVRLTPAKLSLGAIETDASVVHKVKLDNRSSQPVTYALGHLPAITSHASYPNNPSVSLSTREATVAFSSPTVTVPGKGNATLFVTFTPPTDGFTGLLFGGYLTLTDTTAGAPPLVVPYGGYQGDYQEFGTLDYNAYGMPLLAGLDGGYYVPGDTLTIDAAAGESAYVLVNLARQASHLRLTARAVTGRNFGHVYDIKYMARNADPSSFFALPWDGRDRRGALVPNGLYVLHLEVLRPLGDSWNAEHWDTWGSGVITVANN